MQDRIEKVAQQVKLASSKLYNFIDKAMWNIAEEMATEMPKVNKSLDFAVVDYSTSNAAGTFHFNTTNKNKERFMSTWVNMNLKNGSTISVEATMSTTPKSDKADKEVKFFKQDYSLAYDLSHIAHDIGFAVDSLYKDKQ